MPKLTVRKRFGCPQGRAGGTAIRAVSGGVGLVALSLSLASAAQAQTAADRSETLEAGKAPVPAPPPEAQLPEIEPIVPDAEFNSAIPSLNVDNDPELDRPLESIDAFERRVAAEQAGAKPTEGQAPPLGDPALANGDAVEEIGDAPVRDAELAKPLVPLDQFQVEPVQFAEEAEAEERTEKVAYSVKVNGIEDADSQTETDLAAMFKGLSALRDGDGEASNVSMVRARLTEDSALMQRILAAEGWYEARVATRLDRGGESEDGEAAASTATPEEARTARRRQALTAVLNVVPGKRYSLAAINVQADPTIPSTLIADNLALKVGEPIVAQRVQGAEAQVAIALPQNGYPFAEVGQRDILLDPATADGVYTLPITVGPRATVGGFATEGDLAFDQKHVEVLARFKRGELYDSRKIDDLRQALVATGLFSTVAAEPLRTGEAVGDGTEYVTIMVKQDAGPPRTIAGTAGYGTGEGLRAEASWTHRNMFPPEGALIVHGVGGTKEQGAGVTFRRANAGKRDRVFEVIAEASHSNYDAYSAYTGRLAARISRDSTPIWQKKYSYAFGAEVVATAEKDYDFALGARARRTFFIGALSGQVGFDRSTNRRDPTQALLDPTDGFRLTALVQPEGSLEDGFNPYVRARIDGSAYFSATDSIVLAGRVRFGTIQGAKRNDIAPSRRFYSGGGGSVRGFGYQKLGPLDPLGDPIGGRSLNEAAAEVRYRFGNFGAVGFFDAGQSHASTMPKFSDLRYGVGLGVRYYTNFGPLRVDVATPLGRRKGEGRINVYVSIGQAF
jgi:translocation and assembly module TamA